MEVTVNLYGEVSKYASKRSFALTVPSGMAVKDVLDHLKIPADLPLAVVVNGIHQDRDHRLADADVLSVFGMGAFQAQT